LRAFSASWICWVGGSAHPAIIMRVKARETRDAVLNITKNPPYRFYPSISVDPTVLAFILHVAVPDPPPVLHLEYYKDNCTIAAPAYQSTAFPHTSTSKACSKLSAIDSCHYQVTTLSVSNSYGDFDHPVAPDFVALWWSEAKVPQLLWIFTD
jgi:hypothetical protein